MSVVKCCPLCKIWPLNSWNSNCVCWHRNYIGQCTSIFSHRLERGSLNLPLFRQLQTNDGCSGKGSHYDRVNSELVMLQLTQEALVKICGSQNKSKTKQDKKINVISVGTHPCNSRTWKLYSLTESLMLSFHDSIKFNIDMSVFKCCFM